MRLVVCVKQVLDATVPLQVVAGAVRQQSPRPIARLGAADRSALERAMLLRDEHGGAVTVVSVGDSAAGEALRYGLARGADRAIQVIGANGDDPIAAAHAAATVLRGFPVDLVLCGGMSDDGGSGVFPAALAHGLAWPLVTAAAALAGPDAGVVRVDRRLERGDREVVGCSLPAVIAADTTLAEPRYVTVRAQHAATAAPVEVTAAETVVERTHEPGALEAAKPRPKRVSSPGAGMSARDRLAHAMTGGVQQKQSGGFVEGSPDAIADEIVRFLEEKGFLASRGG